MREACQTTLATLATPAALAYALFVWTHAPILHAALLASTSLGRLLGPHTCPAEYTARAGRPATAARGPLAAEGKSTRENDRALAEARTGSTSKDNWTTLRVNRFGLMVHD